VSCRVSSAPNRPNRMKRLNSTRAVRLEEPGAGVGDAVSFPLGHLQFPLADARRDSIGRHPLGDGAHEVLDLTA
jgi:hypothetical protein